MAKTIARRKRIVRRDWTRVDVKVRGRFERFSTVSLRQFVSNACRLLAPHQAKGPSYCHA
jgi:hypothetical protein